MNYETLVEQVSSIMETTFETDVMDGMIKQAEQLAYQAVQPPALRKVGTVTFTPDNPIATVPEDFLYPLSFAVVVSNVWLYLLNKDVNFIREAYPNPTTTGVPAHYAMYSATEIIVGPTPGTAYTNVLAYGHYPESIVDAGTTWLGDTFDSILLNGTLVQAARFNRLEPDTVAQFEKLYVQSIGLYKQFGDGKLRQDVYRDGQYREAVK